MILYHEVDPKAVESILRKGLKRTSRGNKGGDTDIKRTDQILDDHRPDALRNRGVSRDSNLYGYMVYDGTIVRITDGKVISVDGFIRESSQAILELVVDDDACFVSDLDRYDRVKAAIESKPPEAKLKNLADEYWQRVAPIRKYVVGTVRRPEVMITCDVKSDDIRLRS